MDNTVLREKHDTIRKFTVENVLIINFIKAIENNDYKLMANDCTEDDFEYVYNEYIKLVDVRKRTIIELKIEHTQLQYFATHKLIEFLTIDNSDKIITELNNRGYNIDSNYTENDLINAFNENNKLLDKIKLLKSQQPDLEENNDNSIYDTIANLSINVGFDLDYTKLTIIKFISYNKIINNK